MQFIIFITCYSLLLLLICITELILLRLYFYTVLIISSLFYYEGTTVFLLRFYGLLLLRVSVHVWGMCAGVWVWVFGGRVFV